MKVDRCVRRFGSSGSLLSLRKAHQSDFERHYACCKRKRLLRDTKRFERAKATQRRFAFFAMQRQQTLVKPQRR